MKLSNLLHKVNYFLVLSVVFLTPLFFLPTTTEFYEFNKQALLIIAASVSMVIWSITFILERQVKVVRSPLGLPLFAILAAFLLSAILRTPNKFDAFVEPGQVSTIISLVILYFTGINAMRSKAQVESIVTAFQVSLISLAVVTILWASGLFSSIAPVNFMKSPIWTPTGNATNTLAILLLSLPFNVILFLKNRSSLARSKVTTLGVLVVTALLGAGLLSFRLFFSGNDFKPVFLSQGASWAIALEALKSSPIFGTGPATYLQDFTKFRPVSYNTTEMWAIRFSSSSNYYLQILSTVGVLGLLAYVVFGLNAVNMLMKTLRTSSESALQPVALASSVTLVLALIAQLFVPTGLVYLAFIFFLALMSIGSLKQIGSNMVHEANIDIVASSENGHKSPILPWVSLVFSLALIVPSLYFAARAYFAEVLAQKALTYATQNDGKGTYETLIKAINTFPYRDAYRVMYSQTNILLANSIATTASTEKRELTTDQKTTISQLIQQAIREAKNGVALNPEKVTNVENMANTYRQLLSLAKGADAWTVASYQRAIQLDPVNPNLRISLGGVLYALKNYDESLRLFQQAADLKPDLANAYYNASAAYEQKGDYTKSYAAMQNAVNLVKKDSQDYPKATAQLDALKKKLDEKVAGAKTETPAVNPNTRTVPAKSQIELPQDLGPDVTPAPAAPLLPAVSPSPIPAP